MRRCFRFGPRLVYINLHCPSNTYYWHRYIFGMKEQWKEFIPDMRQTKLFIGLPKKKGMFCLSISRRELRIATRLLSGHCPYIYHQNKMDLVDGPTCSGARPLLLRGSGVQQAQTSGEYNPHSRQSSFFKLPLYIKDLKILWEEC